MEEQTLIIDGHCDSIKMVYDKQIELDNTQLMFNIKDAMVFLPYVQFLATYVPTEYNLEKVNSYQYATNILNKWNEQYGKYKEKYKLEKIEQYSNMEKVIQENKLGILLSLENGAIIGTNVNNINKFYDKGIRVMGITWNDDNLLGCGALTQEDKGLTIFGKACIKRMNSLGIIVDVSHTSYQTFMDIANLSDSIIATHSCVFQLCQHNRNLKDEQIKIIAQKGGAIGICFYRNFLKKEGKATIETIVDHIEYIANLVGIDYVGLGSDFDGLEPEGLPIGLTRMREIGNLSQKMKQRGFTSKEIGKVLGANFCRVLKEKLK